MRYFIATYYKTPNGKFNESVKVDVKVRKADLQTAAVIIDYKERKIVKSTFQDELGTGRAHNFDTINDFYKQHHPHVISQLEAKFEVLTAALEMARTVVCDDTASEEVKAALEDIAKADVIK